MTRTLLVGLGAAAVLLVACSADETDFKDAATGLIEGSVGESLALGDLDATCEEPASNEVGTPFSCTATTPDGETVTFDAEIQDDDKVLVYATSYDKVAARIIEGELAAQLGLGNLLARCDPPPTQDVGAEFDCTATTDGGDTITARVQVREQGEVNVQTTNVLMTENLDAIESEAARILSEQVGTTLPAENVDCGSHAVVAEPGLPFVCALTDPASGEVYDASITLDDVSNPTQLDIEVAATPRA